MNFRLPSESKVAIICLTTMEVVFALNGCNHSIQLVGLAAVSGLGGFTLGMHRSPATEGTKSDG
jgi:hypothetical protein